jgi:hypothetical protein
MTYRTVFDVASIQYGWMLLPFGLIAVILGIILVADRNLIAGWWRTCSRWRKIFTIACLGLAAVWATLMLTTTILRHEQLSNAERGGTAKVVEGTVRNFTVLPKSERFCVAAKCFEYSDYVITGGFNNTSSHGGPIREGLPVRVTYVGATISKLEVAN